ncbi:MAG: tetratricopeptide repeat protein [Candidatus Rokubacteria bacterium]|nr:tetratricopeptide repeat protein [Candidatus Rokubacteria bacterium]
MPAVFRQGAPGARRWILWSVVALGCLLLVALGGRAWWGFSQSRGVAELDLVLLRVRGAQGSPAPAEARADAIKALESVIQRYPRLKTLAQAVYQLGNLHYQAGSFGEARKAYELALARGARGSLATLCRLGIGYTWEVQGDHAKALAAFEAGLQGLTPQEFLYEEFLLGVARAQQLLGQRDRAREAYQRLLKELPQSRRAEDVRARLASLEGPARP